MLAAAVTSSQAGGTVTTRASTPTLSRAGCRAPPPARLAVRLEGAPGARRLAAPPARGVRSTLRPRLGDGDGGREWVAPCTAPGGSGASDFGSSAAGAQGRSGVRRGGPGGGDGAAAAEAAELLLRIHRVGTAAKGSLTCNQSVANAPFYCLLLLLFQCISVCCWCLQ